MSTSVIPPDEMGELVVELATPSVLFNNTASIDVRDEGLRLVKRIASGTPVQLRSGLYQVSAVLQDGREHRQIANVQPGKRENVTFVRSMGVSASAPPAPPMPAPSTASPPLAMSIPRRSLRRIFEREPDFAAAETPEPLLQLAGARIEDRGDSQWRLAADGPPTTMPTAGVHVDGKLWRISLPIYPGDGDCLLRVDDTSSKCPVSAWVAPERTMVSALQNMLLEGEFASLAPVAEQAIELLREKYQDPCGATLGALILHKLGRLQPHIRWLENLARDFAWIPDGDILLASLRVQDHQDLDRALELVLCAAKRRPLHAESYSILLDMLRRWPKASMVEPHAALVADLARRCPYVAWKSLYFCHFEPDAR